MPDYRPSDCPALAALDLGSNSFRLEVGHVRQGRYQRQHCRKDQIGLGAGLDGHGLLTRETIERGLNCLRHFAADLSSLQPARVRVVATQTLREARNSALFVRRAEALLGLPVEVISGQEEARLIYTGVAFLQPSTRRRLVIDIGGRSTELIVGQARAAEHLESFRVGSASLSQQFFPDGRMNAARFRAARSAVIEELGPAIRDFGPARWDEAMGSSGTAGMLSAVLRKSGVTDGSITPAGLRWLARRCIEAGSVLRLELPGLKPERRALLPGGLAILQALSELCEIGVLQPAKGALRQGVIVDLHERNIGQAAAVDPVVHELQQRFKVDLERSSRVTKVALELHRLLRPDASTAGRRELGRAAALHELGKSVSKRRHHRHGAYLLSNAGTSGMALEELQRLASLVLGQRGGLAKVAPALQDTEFAWQLLSLRLAVILCQENRCCPSVPALRLQRCGRRLCIAIQAPKSDKAPRPVDSIREEVSLWGRSGALDLIVETARC